MAQAQEFFDDPDEEAIDTAERRLQLALDAGRVGTFVWFPDGDEPEPDARMLELFGLPPDGRLSLAAAMERLIHPDDAPRYFSAVAASLDPDGDRRVDEEIRVMLPDGRECWVAVTAVVYFDGAPPRTTRMIGTGADITERKLGEAILLAKEEEDRRELERSELMHAVVSDLSSNRSIATGLRLLVDRLCEEMVAYAAIESSHDDGRVDVIEAGTPGAGKQFVSAVPMAAGTKLVVQVRPQDVEVLPGLGRFVDRLAERVGLTLAAARARDEDHRIALSLQRALLPAAVIRHPEIGVFARYEAAAPALEVGGDWYDSYLLPDGKVGVCVGDVVGHGLEAAIAMGKLRTAMAALAPHASGPAEALERLDAFTADHGDVPYATTCYFVIDPATGTATYASAGHPPILVIDPDGLPTFLEGGRSMPLLGMGTKRTEASITLGYGTVAVLFSDGLVERRGEDLETSLRRLAEAAQRLKHLSIEELSRELVRELTAEPRNDDVVVLCLCRRPVSDGTPK